MKIIYLHGYGSSGTNEKTKLLKNRFGDENVVSPNLPIVPSQVLSIVNGIVRQTKTFPIVFVGTSLGGFWANYFAQLWDAPCVIVNPSTTPSKSLVRYGISEDICKQYEPYENQLYGMDQNGGLVNLVVAKDDDVLPYEKTLKIFSNTKTTHVSNTGGHRYIEN